MATILQIAQDSALAVSLNRPDTLFPTYDEGDMSAADLLRAITACTRDLRDGYDWSVSKARHTFTALAAEVQASKLPSDFKRVVPDTFWNTGIRQKVCGPLTDDEYAEIKGGVLSMVTPHFHMQGGDLIIVPAPTTSDTFAFTYIRTAIGRDSDSVRLAAFTEDTDVPLWDEELMIAGAIYFYRKAKAYDAQQAYLDYEKLRRDNIKRDGGGRIIRMGQPSNGADEMVRKMKQAVIFAS